MKKKFDIIDEIGFYILSFVVMIIIMASCAQPGSPAKPLTKTSDKELSEYIQKGVMVIDVIHEGNVHEWLFWNYNGCNEMRPGGHWSDCKYCRGNNDTDYHGIKNTVNNYTEQLTTLLKAKDDEIEAAENVIKAYEDYMKVHGITIEK